MRCTRHGKTGCVHSECRRDRGRRTSVADGRYDQALSDTFGGGTSAGYSSSSDCGSSSSYDSGSSSSSSSSSDSGSSGSSSCD